MVNMSVKKGDYIMIMEILNIKEVFILVVIKEKGNIMMKTKMFYMGVILIMVNLEEKRNYEQTHRSRTIHSGFAWAIF